MKNKKVYFTFLLIIICIFFLDNCVFAENMNAIYSPPSNETFNKAAGMVLGIVQAVGYATAIIMLTYIGIQFLWTSPDGKAELKKRLIPYCIGIFILFAGGTIVGVIAKTAFNTMK